MNNSSHPTVDRLYDLLADQALFGLESSEQVELETLLKQYPEVGEDEFELTAAAVQAAHVPCEAEEVPASLVERLMAQANQSLSASAAASDQSHVAPKSSTSASKSASIPSTVNKTNSPTAAKSSATVSPREPVRRDSTREVVAWLFAAAAMVVALFAWVDRLSSPPDDSVGGGTPRVASLEEQRDELITKFEDVEQVSWTVNDASFNAPGVETVEGDLVWSDSAQAGFMSIKGLAVDDPTTTSYQLWIFDEDRDQAHPVDGGVFHIESADQVTIIPIDPKLKVSDSVLFAITVEGPEGVVVSDRSRLPLLADPST